MKKSFIELNSAIPVGRYKAKCFGNKIYAETEGGVETVVTRVLSDTLIEGVLVVSQKFSWFEHGVVTEAPKKEVQKVTPKPKKVAPKVEVKSEPKVEVKSEPKAEEEKEIEPVKDFVEKKPAPKKTRKTKKKKN
jgi:outer membrane biosynthesis protein TonB